MTVVINGTTGITSPSDSLSGNLVFTGTGNRITGDFSNATITNRVMFQTSTANGATRVHAIPNGTSTTAALATINNADPTNASFMQLGISATEAVISSTVSGTGTYLPMTFYTGGSERMRVDTSGNLLVGTTTQATGCLLTVNGSIKGTITSGTAVASTSGTSIDFTSIPSWVKRITVMFQAVSTSGTSQIIVRLGTSGGFVSSGYSGACGNRAAETYFSTAFIFSTDVAAAGTQSGQMIICNLTSNTWTESSVIAGVSANAPQSGAGSIALGGVLTQVRITTVNGTDTFDAGSINILYEG